MSTLRFRLMQREAAQRLDDARQLSKSDASNPFSNSAHLLCLLALELLLKLVYEAVLGRPRHGHDYNQIFSELPQETQARLLTLAEERIGQSALSINPDGVLNEWARNFIDLRYPYERYEGMTEAEYKRLADDWVQRGGPLDDAQFRFYPEELYGILHALGVVTTEMA